MKKFIAAIAALCLAAGTVGAQEPTSTWPYVYPEFTQGKLVMPGGQEKSALFNVHLLYGKLHYIDGDLIKEVSNKDIFSVQIGPDVYVCANTRMMKLLARNDSGCVLQDTEIDVVKLNSTGGAYGSSTSSVSTRALSSLEGIGGTNSSNNINHMELRASRESGQVLPLLQKNYLLVNGRAVEANRKEVSDAVEDRAALGAFLKENKIKWKDPQSLMLLVDYLSSHE